VFALVSTSTYNLLTFGGWSLIAGLLLLVVVPYWRGKADLVTAWNFALVGCTLFIGVACLDAIDPQKLVFAQYISFDFPDDYYRGTLGRSLFFLACLLTFYYLIPVGRKFASKRFTNSPPWSPMLFMFVLGLCAATAAAALVLGVSNVAFFREVFMNLGHKAATFAACFSFYAWYRNRSSPVALLIFVVVFGVSALYVMRVSHGRRLLLCVAFAPLAVMYWTKWRYLRPSRVLLAGGVGIACVVAVGLWYQTFRFFDRGRHASERTFANTFEAAKQVTFASVTDQFHDWKYRLAQGVFQYGMVVKRLVDSGQLEARPLNTVQFILSYPIPRRFWEGKPEPIGAVIVTDVLKLPQKTNWGLGVAGQGYYEGDWYALPVYALMLVLMVRLIDEPMKREPNNPFFIAVCASASLFLITWLRGDLGVHTAEILECFLYLVMLRFAGAAFVGSQKGAYALDFGSMFRGTDTYLTH
jgi:hypothetical protein